MFHPRSVDAAWMEHPKRSYGVKTTEREIEDLAMPWESVRAIFPYGLPASLRCEQPSCGSNVIDFEQWCRRHREKTAVRTG
jgi:hypothetical protein